MLQTDKRDIDQNTPAPAGLLASTGAGTNQRASTSSRYVAFDIRSPYFAGKDAKEKHEELAQLYMTIFNGVATVPDQWTADSAVNMVSARLGKFGCNIALVDTSTNKIIGAFLSNIVPGAKGWNLTHPDVLLAVPYRNMGLGAELGYLGRTYGNEICFNEKGEYLVDNDSKTYKEPEFPRVMWVSKGYSLHPLFTQSSKEVFSRSSSSLLEVLAYEDVKREDFDSIIDFMCKPDVVSSDGSAWDKTHAAAYVKFMYEHHLDTFSITKLNDQIVAVSSADIMPDRTGTSMVETQIFVKSDAALRRDGAVNLSQNNIALASFYSLLTASNAVAKHRWKQGVSSIEIPERSAKFFGDVLPSLQEDQHFFGMEGRHDTLMKNLQPPVRGRIALVGASPAPGAGLN